jgi:hypothetical protein
VRSGRTSSAASPSKSGSGPVLHQVAAGRQHGRPGRRGGPAVLGDRIHAGAAGARPGHRRGRLVARHGRVTRPACRRRTLDGRASNGGDGPRGGPARPARSASGRDVPFSWTAEDRPRRCPSAGRTGPYRRVPVGCGAPTPGRRRSVELLADVPPPDRLVVCHGDSCAPNTLLSEDGRWSAHVDLGRLGVADRWAGLAVAVWSTEWNYGPGKPPPRRLRRPARPRPDPLLPSPAGSRRLTRPSGRPAPGER